MHRTKLAMLQVDGLPRRARSLNDRMVGGYDPDKAPSYPNPTAGLRPTELVLIQRPFPRGQCKRRPKPQ